jgi:hypothetical protein
VQHVQTSCARRRHSARVVAAAHGGRTAALAAAHAPAQPPAPAWSAATETGRDWARSARRAQAVNVDAVAPGSSTSCTRYRRCRRGFGTAAGAQVSPAWLSGS